MKDISQNKTLRQDQGEIRVRIAPSPTGPLHIGTSRTALFNYLFARHHNGKFILRIEDTDLERSDIKYEKDIIEGLKWLGLKWDLGPYRQSRRIKIYRKYIQELLNKNLAYFCPCSEEELKKEKNSQMEQKLAPKHICPYRNKKLEKGIIRFKTPEQGQIEFDDLIRGKVKFDLNLIGDFSIAKAIDIPLYNFAVVIDDYTMKISHVIRGEDHISNTPKQILIQGALNLPSPQYGHLPLILGPDKSKLSKRHAVVSVRDYQEQGYIPEAMINFMALLGWNPGTEEEIFTLKNLEKRFSLDRVGKSGAIFNIERLDYLNGYYIRQMPIKKLTKLCLPYTSQISKLKSQKYNSKFKTYLEKIVALEQERIKKLSEITEKTRYFFVDKLEYDAQILKWKNMTDEEIKGALQRLCDITEKIPEKQFNKRTFKKVIMPVAEIRPAPTEGRGIDRGRLLWPLRAALTGLKASPEPFGIMEILGKEKTLKRLREALIKLTKSDFL